MKSMYVLLLILFLGCASLKHFDMLDVKSFATVNIVTSTQLATQQKAIFDKYKVNKEISKNELDSLKNNMWVKSVEKLAPGNLVIRQYALIDLIKNENKHKNQIKNLLNCLSYGESENRIWSEGYSYWLFTKDILDYWIIKFNDVEIKKIMTEIDNGFVSTAYLRDFVWYPAPYGDLKNIPLTQDLQELCKIKTEPASSEVANVKLIVNKKQSVYVIYVITARPIGMNWHISVESDTIIVMYGIPTNFKWYISKKDKYKNDDEELKDLLNIKRLETINYCK